jgi:hypothetical protein
MNHLRVNLAPEGIWLQLFRIFAICKNSVSPFSGPALGSNLRDQKRLPE